MHTYWWPHWALTALLAGATLPGWLAILVACLSRRRNLAAGCIVLSLWTGWRCQPEPDPLAQVVGQTVEVMAIVCEPAVATKRGCRYAIEVHHWLDRVHGFEGRWLVESPQAPDEVALGDWWHLRGKLSSFVAPAYPGDWDGGLYWSRKGVTQRLRVFQADFVQPAPAQGFWSRTYFWRYRLTQRLADRLPPDSAALLCAVVYGDGSRLSQDLMQQFRLAGVSHLLVASGTNVALLILWIYWIGARCGWGPVRCSGLGLWLIPVYVGLTGASPSMLRAGSMGWLAMLARWTGYSLGLGRSLVLGSLGVLLWDPLYVYDVGFQLSFAAVASLAWITPWFDPWIPKRIPCRLALCASLACTVGLAPISLYVFRVFQPLAPISNLWMGPLVEGLLPVGLLLSLVDLMDPRLGLWGGKLIDPWLWFVRLSVQRWADWSPYCEVPDPGCWGGLAWLWLLVLLRLGPNLVSVGGAALLTACSLILASTPYDPLRVRGLWLGKEPALWICEGRRHVLFLTTIEQKFWAQRLRLAHGYRDYDHILALGENRRYQVGWAQGWIESDRDRLVYHRGSLQVGLGPPGNTLSVSTAGKWCWQGGEVLPLERDRPLQLRLDQDNWLLEVWK